jgi:hypothetical protein
MQIKLDFWAEMPVTNLQDNFGQLSTG